MTSQNGKGSVTPLPLAELWAWRTDYEDVAVPELGGHELRVYALTGAARAKLLTDMSALAGRDKDEAAKDPEVVRAVMLFEGRVVAASLGYPEGEWDAVLDTLGSGAIERLYEAAARLSALDAEAQDEARVRLRRRRSAASGTG